MIKGVLATVRVCIIGVIRIILYRIVLGHDGAYNKQQCQGFSAFLNHHCVVDVCVCVNKTYVLLTNRGVMGFFLEY